jgi:hypothetical protein
MRWPSSLARTQTLRGSRCALAAIVCVAMATACSAAEPISIGVAIDRDSLVYGPGETLRLRVEAQPPGVEPGGAFDFEVALATGRSGPVIWRGESTRESLPAEGGASIEIEAPLPKDEGIVRVLLRATRPAGFTKRFMPSAAAKPIAERSFQVLVLDPARRPGVPSDWRESHALQPASPRWRDRLPTWTSWRRLSWIEGGSPGSLQGGPTRVAGSSMVELPPAATPEEADWQAYPLPVTRPGRTCLVEVELDLAPRGPGSAPSQACLVVLDADSAGALRPLGEGVVVEAPRWNAPAGPTTVRLTCFPRTNAPLLVVANPSPRAPLRYGAVRVLQSSDETPATEASPRCVALDWSRGELAELVGASVDLAGDRDLASSYEAATIAAERVALAGATAAVVSIDPIDVPHADHPRDLPVVDPLALTLAEFERRGLGLIVTLRPRCADRTAAPWVSSRGKPLADSQSPLDPAAQRELAAAMDRLVARCGASPALAGVAVRLGSDELLAGDEWGFDGETVDRFLASMSKRWPAGFERSPATHAAAIESNAAEDWARYRYTQVAQVFGDWRSKASAARPHGAGFVALGSVELLADTAKPRLARNSGIEALLRARGLIAADAGGGALPIASPRALALDSPLAELARGPWLAQEIRQELDAARPAEPATAAELIASTTAVHLRGSGPLLDGDSNAPDLVIACVTAPLGGDQAMLAESIADGAPMTVVDATAARAGLLDDRAVATRRLMASLPARAVSPNATTPASRGRDVALEAYETADATVVLAVNTTPWQTEAQATLNTPTRSLATILGDPGDGQRNEWYEAGSHAVQVSLAPYEAIAWRFASRGVEPEGVRERFPAAALAELQSRVSDARSRDLTRRRDYQRAPNPSFESIDALGGPIGWRVVGSTVPPETGDKQPRDGARTLVVSSSAGRGVVCEPFPLPSTGQLAATFSTRAGELSPNAELRLAIEEVGGPYRVETRVPVGRLAGADGDEWRSVLFAVDDLPVDPHGRIRLRFTLDSDGQVEVDDLRLEDLMLPLEEYAEDQRSQKLALVKLSHAAETALADGRLGDARRLIDSYWSRFVVECFPPLETPPTVAANDDAAGGPEPVAPQTAEAPAAEPDDEGQTPGSITSRVKRLLWRPWR